MASDSSTAKKYKDFLLHQQEKTFFTKLEKFTGPLRHSAQEMVACIDQLSWKNEALSELKQAYVALETMSVKDLESGIDVIKDKFLKIDFAMSAANDEAMNNADFVMYFDRQNHFNAEINTLIKKAIELGAVDNTN